MTDPNSASENDAGKAAESDPARYQPEKQLGEYFRFRPIRLYGDLAAKAEAYQSAKSQRDYFTNLLRYSVLAIVANRWFRVACCTGVVGIVALASWKSEYFTANTTIALFTIVLAAAALVQWWTANAQLLHLREERRPWLAVVNPRVSKIGPGHEVRIFYRIENSGATPATIIRVATDTCLIRDVKKPGLAEALSKRSGQLTLSVSVVPPGGVAVKISPKRL
jgi:hypothetical protein